MDHNGLIEISKKHLWLPFTQMKDYDEHPLIIESGEGVKVKDTEGNEYYDGFSSVWLNIHGHRKQELDEAVKAQLGRIAHSTLLGMSNVPATELAERLVKIAPSGLTRVFYSDSGATAVEVALKMAYQYWKNKGVDGKNTFITMKNGYHGDTVGAVSVGAVDLFHQIYRPLLFKSLRVNYPYVYRHPSGEESICVEECLQELKDTLERHHRGTAAVILEPMMQGAGGMIRMPDGYLPRVKEICEEYGVLVIFDEVATGFGRTGRMFACGHDGVTPDIMTVGKGITGGYLPIAATLTTEKVYEAFYADYTELKTFFHGHSYTGNPVGCAVALANLDLFEQENIVEQVYRKSAFVGDGLRRLYDHDHVGDIRQIGLMAGVELVKDKAAKQSFAWDERTGYKVTLQMRKEGMLTRPMGDVLVFMPPLSSTQEELKAMIDIMEHSIRRVL